MIVSRTPFRISFFGGGTDFPSWYLENGGQVLSTTIDKYCYITCRTLSPFFKYRHRIVYAREECVNQIDEIQHPSVRETFRFMDIRNGFSIHHDGDLPARSGIGSSSAFTTGLVNTLYAHRGKLMSKRQLANDVIDIEQNWIKEHIGSQDQIAAVYGGFNQISFRVDGSYEVSPIVMNREFERHLVSHLCLYFTGLSRNAEHIEKDKLAKLDQNRSSYSSIQASVPEAVDLLCNKLDVEGFGRLLDEGWRLKKSLSPKVTTPAIDEIYEAAKQCGAYGGKLLGAGGGGFILFVAPPGCQDRLHDRLSKLVRIPFEFEKNGSQIVFYQPSGY